MKVISSLQSFVAVTICVIVLVSGCARPPQPDVMRSARELVAKAYAQGASRLAAEEYLAASSALSNAEQQLRSGDKDLAWDSLRLAREYALEAIRRTEQEKRQRLEAIQQQKLVQEDIKTVVVKPAPPVKTPPHKPAVVQKTEVAPKPELVSQVEVRAGETLSNIAARKEVYGDPLLWPLVYKANRDQIKDPRTIFPGQTLTIPRDKSDQEKEIAREEARSLKLFR